MSAMSPMLTAIRKKNESFFSEPGSPPPAFLASGLARSGTLRSV
jgi:hypothetical protein